MAGWDCHGLPVELEVEKELGFTGKPDIERYGIAEFNERCRESVRRHVDAFEAMSERMGYWADYDRAYETMRPEYVESVWWALKRIFDQGLLVEDFRVTPYCPRCGTGLSDHELAQGYQTVVDPSVFVRLPLTSGPYAGTAAMLIWTTTPWTLPANVAAAVKPDAEYGLSNGGWRLAETGGEYERIARGDELVGLEYSGPFDELPAVGIIAHKPDLIRLNLVVTGKGTKRAVRSTYRSWSCGSSRPSNCMARCPPQPPCRGTLQHPSEANSKWRAHVTSCGSRQFPRIGTLAAHSLHFWPDKPVQHQYPFPQSPESDNP
jgi:isoleucyl-tRNA synthetase